MATFYAEMLPMYNALHREPMEYRKLPPDSPDYASGSPEKESWQKPKQKRP